MEEKYRQPPGHGGGGVEEALGQCVLSGSGIRVPAGIIGHCLFQLLSPLSSFTCLNLTSIQEVEEEED